MKVLVVDSDFPSRERMRSVLKGISDIELASQDAAEGKEAVSLVQKWQPDVVLMEAHMSNGGMDGIKAAEYMGHMALPPAIILCSSSPQDALEAYNVNAAGFLIKPLDTHRLTSAIKRASKLNQLQLKSLSSKQINSNIVASTQSNEERENSSEKPQHISAKTYRGIELIPIKDIVCFKADNKYVTVYHTNGEVLIDRTLKSLQEQLGDSFIRVHRNALVAKSSIKALERKQGGSYLVRLNHFDISFSVSRRHVPIMRKLIKTL